MYVVGYEFSGGQLDGSLQLLDDYLGATVESFVGRTKTDLFRVNSQCSVGEVVSSLGQYFEILLTKLDTASGDSTMMQLSLLAVARESAFDLLLKEHDKKNCIFLGNGELKFQSTRSWSSRL